MKNKLFFCLCLLFITSMQIASDNSSENNKKITLVLVQDGTNPDVFNDIVSRVNEMGLNQLQLIQNQKPLATNSGIRLFMKNVNLILELEKIIDDKRYVISPLTKSDLCIFTAAIKLDLLKIMKK